MSKVEAALRQLIQSEGPQSVARVIGLANAHYYATRDPFGRGGDFITAPEISQMFGELIGAWAATMWHAMGQPVPLRLIEIGPGRGTLMSDALRAARALPGFVEAAEVHLVETSPVLRQVQAKALGGAVSWHDNIEDIPPGPSIILANEFFDALPIRQFLRTEQGWAERVVGLENDALTFGLIPAPEALIPENLRGAAPGEIIETSPDSLRIMALIAKRIAEHGGAALFIDYGYVRNMPLTPTLSPQAGRGSPVGASSASFLNENDGARPLSPYLRGEGRGEGQIETCEGHLYGDTLQALKSHRFHAVLENLGEADLTAHVDFAALAATAHKEGAKPHGPVTQRDLLLSLGLLPRAARLKESATPAQRADIDAATQRLTDPAQTGMGALFKALAVTHADLPAPPGF